MKLKVRCHIQKNSLLDSQSAAWIRSTYILKMTVFRDAVSYIIEIYQRFRCAFVSITRTRRPALMMEAVSTSETSVNFTRLHDETFEKTRSHTLNFYCQSLRVWIKSRGEGYISDVQCISVHCIVLGLITIVRRDDDTVLITGNGSVKIGSWPLRLKLVSRLIGCCWSYALYWRHLI